MPSLSVFWVLILIALPFFISVNVFRPALERHLSLALRRKVEVRNLSLSLLSGALAAETFSISDDPGMDPLGCEAIVAERP